MRRLLILLLALPMIAQATGSDWLTHTLDHRGPYCALSNPALLAERTLTDLGIQIAGVGGLGVTASNNSFSVAFWNSHVATNRFWSASDTRAILRQIPRSGFSAQAEANIPLLGVRYRGFAFNVGLLGMAHANVPKSVAEIALVGSTLNADYSLNDLIGESLALTDVAMSYGQIISQNYVPELAVGVGLHYYHGLTYTDTRNSTGGFVVTDNLIEGSGHFQNIVATNGLGLAADLGAAATLTKDGKWKAALAIQRIGPSMIWYVEETRTTQFSSTMAGGVNFDSLRHAGYADRALSHDNTKTTGGTTQLRLPLTIHGSAQYQAFSNVSITTLLDVLTIDSPLGRRGVEAGAVTEYTPLRWLAVEGGILLGGRQLSLYSGGVGLRFRHYEMDLSGSVTGGMFTSAHGVGASFSQRFLF